MTDQIVLRSGTDVLQAIALLKRLGFKKPVLLTLKTIEPKARTDQEAVLRGMESKIARHTGTGPQSVHDELLKAHYGVIRIQAGKHVFEEPARRTRSGPNPLGESEMQEHLRFVEAWAATELGLTV